MSANGGASLGTLLVSVPLAAIPLMAIFGVPEFAPVVASPEKDEVSLGEWSADSSHPDRYGDRANDLLDEYGEYDDRFPEPLCDAPAYEPPGERGADDVGRRSRPSGLAVRWPPSSEEDAPAYESEGSAELGEPRRLVEAGTEPPAIPESTAGSLTWQTAARRLNDLDINDYHLEPGLEPGTFLFVCAFAPQDDPNVTMRFEAESSEPLGAVEDVLQQVDEWLRQRFAESRRAELNGGP